MNKIYDLPISIYFQIREFFLAGLFFTPEDLQNWRNFVNCDKCHFKPVKRHTIYYNLDMAASSEYLGNPSKDVLFSPSYGRKVAEKIQEIIEQPSLQIGLVLNSEIQSTLSNKVHTIRLYDATITNLEFVKDKAFFVCVMSSFTLSNLQPLERTRYINLSNCSKIKDITPLQYALEVDLSWCNNLQNIVSLKNVQTVILRGCKKIKDISALSSVKKLSLAYCTNVNDISSLSHVQDLDIEGCTGIKHLKYLTHVEILNIIKLDGNNLLSFLPEDCSLLKKLFFTTELIPFLSKNQFARNACRQGVKFICYDSSSSFLTSISRESRESSGIHMQQHILDHLNPDAPPSPAIPSVLTNESIAEAWQQGLFIQKKLEFHSLSIPFLLQLQSVTYLTLTCCTDIEEEFHSLPSLKYVRFYSINSIRTIDFNRLPSLKEVTLQECAKLQELILQQPTPILKRVYVHSCHALRDVHVQQIIEKIVLLRCDQLDRVRIKMGIPLGELTCDSKCRICIS
jgi:hypothetical protein